MLLQTDEPVPISDDPAEQAARSGSWTRWAVIAVIVLLLAGWALLGQGPAFRAVQANLDRFQAWTQQHWLPALAAFFLLYATCASLPLPVLTVMSLLAGCLFGRWLGTGVASLAYTAGVTVAFLSARWLLRDRVQRQFGPRLRRIQRGFEHDGAFFLLTLRLMPAIPFFLINWLMALTPIRARTFAAVSWLGALPLTFLYASVGTELAAMDSPADLLSPSVLLSLAALGVVPLLIRKLIQWRL